MTEEEQLSLDILVERIKNAVNPYKIMLFGSKARGDAGNKSDFDLLIIGNSDKPRFRRTPELYRLATDLPLEVDIVFYTIDEIEEWKYVNQAFITTAINEGRILYER